MAISKDELKHRVELATNIARMEGKIDVIHEKLDHVLEVRQTVLEHDRQINFWRGANSILASVIAIGLTIAGSLYAKFRHWF